MLTDTERKLVLQLGEIYNEFCTLCQSEPGLAADVPDFCDGIHRLQRIVMARPARRELMEAPDADCKTETVDDTRTRLEHWYGRPFSDEDWGIIANIIRGGAR